MFIHILKTDTCDRVKQEKYDRNDSIVDAIDQKGMSCSPHIWHAFAMYDKGGDVPCHHEHTHSTAQQEHTHKVDLAQILRSKEQGGCTKVSSKMPRNRECDDKPEAEQQLILTEMEQHQLYRQKIIKAPEGVPACMWYRSVIQSDANF